MTEPRTVPVLLGPTGVGKTEVAFDLARRYNWEIVSVDSRQCYQFMEIGTAKPTRQMLSLVPHYLLDLCPPDHQLSAGEFARHAWELLMNLDFPLAVGGSGFYLRAIFEPLNANLPHNPIIREELNNLPTPTLVRKLKAEDPPTAEKLHPNDRQRILRALEVCLAARRPYSELIAEPAPLPPVKPVYVGLMLERKKLIQKHTQRLEEMFAQGFLDEVSKLRDMGFSQDLYAFNAYGYRELYDYLDGKSTLVEAKETITKKIKLFAKRQITFFKTLGDIHWVNASSRILATQGVERVMRQYLPDYFPSPIS